MARVLHTSRSSGRSLAGTRAAKLVLLGLLISIMFGRWGSYLGLSLIGISLSDVLIVSGVSLYLMSARTMRITSKASGFYTFCLLLVLGIGFYLTDRLSPLVVRDAAPFVYLLLIPILIPIVGGLDSLTIRKWIYRAVSIHTLWYLPVTLGLLSPLRLGPVSSLPVFTPRNDFDAMISGLAIVVALGLGVGRPSIRAIVAIGALVSILANGSRAGFLAAVVAVLIFVLLNRPWRNRKWGPYGVSLALATSAIMLVIISSGLQPSGWSKVLTRLVPSNSAEYTSALNTSEARSSAWDRIFQYVEYRGSEYFGMGFGTDYIRLSGALEFLSGDASVRQPHNFLVSWYAMLGVVGTGIALLAIIVFILHARQTYNGSELHVLGWAIICAVFITSLVGVIMESPFGYSTFVLGLLLVTYNERERGDQEEFEVEKLAHKAGLSK